MNMTKKQRTAATLKAALPLIENPATFTTHYFATDAAGRDVHSSDPSAVCFCSLGALRRVTGKEDHTLPPEYAGAVDALTDVAQRYGHFMVTDLNDHRAHKTVVLAWRTAIAETLG